jgi:hypothetical protein
MKKILELLVYKSNRWYDNLEEEPRFLFFLGAIFAPIGIANALLILYGLWQPFAVLIMVFLFWRMAYFTRKSNKIYFDIETYGLISKESKDYNTQSFDYLHITKKLDGMNDQTDSFVEIKKRINKEK